MAEEPAKQDVPPAPSASSAPPGVTGESRGAPAAPEPASPAPAESETLEQRRPEPVAPRAAEPEPHPGALLQSFAPPPVPNSSRRLVLLGVAFIAPCVVIALSTYAIVRGGAVRELSSAPAASSSGSSPLPGSPDTAAPDGTRGELDTEPSAAPETVGSGPVTLENPEAPVLLAPGFEDEGMDEEPSPSKPSPPKRFATVQEAAAGSCSTESVDGLSRQIIEQARCIKPKDFVALPKRPNLLMAPNVYPYLELSARDALLRALDGHKNQPMTINSCLRTVAQQYLVSRWSLSRTCGVQLATHPGESNHEIGTALDIKEAGTWRPALEAEDFRWLGASDRVHFDYKGPSAGTRSATDVLAFQKLWNRNHKDDPINETGRYDAPTEQRLKKSPPAGFPLGASCKALAR